MNVGKTSIGGSTAGLSGDNMRVCGPYAMTAGLVIVGAFFYASGAGGDEPVRQIIYADSSGVPGALAAVGTEITITAGAASQWWQMPISYIIPVTGNYWIGNWAGSGNQAGYFYDLNGAISRYIKGVTYSSLGNPSDPFAGSLTDTREISQYLQIQDSAPPISIPRPTVATGRW